MIHCVAIDDEPIALSILNEYCGRIGDVELKCFTSPVAGLEYINDTHPRAFSNALSKRGKKIGL